ncbi:hypothetical protein DAI22_01g004100 [Oryza sativa Japonica Group]|nr:hypothetical protein DAI22_01g004100 [Oryza sativa Japonica Group]
MVFRKIRLTVKECGSDRLISFEKSKFARRRRGGTIRDSQFSFKSSNFYLKVAKNRVRISRLFYMCLRWTHGTDDGCSCISTQRKLENACQL